MQTIIATCPAWPQGNADLRALAAALDAALIPWPEIPPGPAIILPLAVWDYSTDPAAYRRWLHEQVQVGARFINSPALTVSSVPVPTGPSASMTVSTTSSLPPCHQVPSSATAC